MGLPASAAVVSTCDEASLRAAMDQGGTVTFACDGTIVLAHAILVRVNVALDGTGRDVRISGNDAVRLFDLWPGRIFSITNLALVNGRTNHGAAIFNDGGNVTLVNCALLNHTALGAAAVSNSDEANASGGAIFNRTGVVTAVSCILSNNQARGSGNVPMGLRGGLGNGGVIMNEFGNIGIANCQFVMNSAAGGEGGGFFFIGGAGGGASGGAIYSWGGTIDAGDSVFRNNSAIGGRGGGNDSLGRGNGGFASGGAIYLVNAGVLRTSSTRLISNRVQGGSGDGGNNGGTGGTVLGGALALENSRADADGCEFTGNTAFGGLGGRTRRGGNASGGAISCPLGAANLTACILSSNVATAGWGRPDSGSAADGLGGGLYHKGTSVITRVVFAGNNAGGAMASTRPNSGSGGAGKGGAVYNEGGLTVRESALLRNAAHGGAGNMTEAGTGFNNGGDGCGGAVYNNGELHLANTTLNGNLAFGGSAVDFGLPGTPFGGAIFNARTADILNSTIAANGVLGAGSSVYAQSSITFLNSIVALPTLGDNCSGQIQDAGHNISDSGCFTHPTSRNNLDPRLGPLRDNGGPAPTMALLVNSPAIDAALDAAAPATDQRGISRPQGAHSDIGAFEAQPGELRSRLEIFRASTDEVAIRLLGRVANPYRLEASSSLTFWTSIATNATDADGRTVFIQRLSERGQFYRAQEF